MNLPKLTLQDITLRALSLEDASGEYPQWLNDKKVTQFNSHGELYYTKEMAEEYILSVTGSTTKRVFAIEYKGEHIGNISLQNIDDKKAEFAILLGKPGMYGKGLGERSGLLLIDYAFNTLNLKELFCGTSSQNIGMQRLAIKLGFIKKSVDKNAMRKDGKFVDIIKYTITPKDFPYATM